MIKKIMTNQQNISNDDFYASIIDDDIIKSKKVEKWVYISIGIMGLTTLVFCFSCARQTCGYIYTLITKKRLINIEQDDVVLFTDEMDIDEHSEKAINRNDNL
jgi:hypothetical protein